MPSCQRQPMIMSGLASHPRYLCTRTGYIMKLAHDSSWQKLKLFPFLFPFGVPKYIHKAQRTRSSPYSRSNLLDAEQIRTDHGTVQCNRGPCRIMAVGRR